MQQRIYPKLKKERSNLLLKKVQQKSKMKIRWWRQSNNNPKMIKKRFSAKSLNTV